MKESIYTIPISEAFEQNEECPFCKIHSELERHWVDYITGAAMMEPDVRIKTNELGFCKRHYADMLACKNRLSVALMLQTRLETLITGISSIRSHPGRIKKEPPQDTCFLCDNIESEFLRVLENAVVIWNRDEDFQNMYNFQKNVCLVHSGKILAIARRKLKSKQYEEFAKITLNTVEKTLTLLKHDVDAFCKMYDYRSSAQEQPSADVVSSLERSIDFITVK